MAEMTDPAVILRQQTEVLLEQIDALQKLIREDVERVERKRASLRRLQERNSCHSSTSDLNKLNLKLLESGLSEFRNKMEALNSNFKFVELMFDRCSSAFSQLQQKAETIENEKKEILQMCQAQLDQLKSARNALLKERQEVHKALLALVNDNKDLIKKIQDLYKQEAELKAENKKLPSKIQKLDRKLNKAVEKTEEKGAKLQEMEHMHEKKALTVTEHIAKTMNEIEGLDKANETVRNDTNHIKSAIETYQDTASEERKKSKQLKNELKLAKRLKERNLHALQLLELELKNKEVDLQQMAKKSYEMSEIKQNVELPAEESELVEEEVAQMQVKIKVLEQEILDYKKQTKETEENCIAFQKVYSQAAIIRDKSAKAAVVLEKVKELDLELKKKCNEAKKVKAKNEIDFEEKISKINKEYFDMSNRIIESQHSFEQLQRKLAEEDVQLKEMKDKHLETMEAEVDRQGEIEMAETAIAEMEHDIEKVNNYKKSQVLMRRAIFKRCLDSSNDEDTEQPEDLLKINL